MNLLLRALLALILCQCLLPRPAAAGKAEQDEDPITARARIHLEAGVAYFSDGKYADAEREMSQAYELRPVPELRYNLAQCQERLGALDRAVASYRAYLQGRPDAPDKGEVERHIAELEQRLQVIAAEPAPAAPPPAPAPAERVVFKEIVVYKEQPPKAGRIPRIVGYSLLGLAAVGLASGVTFTVSAVQLNSGLQDESTSFMTNYGTSVDSCSDPNTLDTAIRAKAQSDSRKFGGGGMDISQSLYTQYKASAMNACNLYNLGSNNQRFNTTGAAIGFAIAGASVVGSVGMFLYGRYLDRKQERQLRGAGKVSVQVQPYGSATGAGLVLAGRF